MTTLLLERPFGLAWEENMWGKQFLNDNVYIRFIIQYFVINNHKKERQMKEPWRTQNRYK